MERKVNVVEDFDGNRIVFIHDVLFKGKRSIEWMDVETYLKQFVSESYVIEDTKDLIYIGTDFPDEYSHSKYTTSLRGTNAKAKANAAQGVPEMIEIATKKEYRENSKDKHNKDAKYGWYRYESRFALPVSDDKGEVAGYNVFHVIMIVRHAKDGKMYLYDIVNIKKETSNLFQS
ncbi:MAG: hypothetical protein ACI39H_00505 [Lachnospiraceae bacterium]